MQRNSIPPTNCLLRLALSSARAAAVLLSLAVVQGCGGAANKYDSTVTGNVLIDGQLVDRGTVTFHPVKGGAPAIGRIRPDGSFSLRTGQGDLRAADGGSVPSGEYLITVVVTGEPVLVPELPDSPPKGGVRLMAEKYATTETTDLRRDVAPGPNLFQFDLEQAAPARPAEGDPAESADTAESAASAVESNEETVPEAAPPSKEAKPAEATEEPSPAPDTPNAEGIAS